MLLAVSILALLSLASATQCPPHGSVRYMIPHETDCSKFYICAHGVPLLQSCPEGTHFNNNFMVCQNPVFAGCSNELPGSELECSWPDLVLFRPHPDTCSKYYVCEYGTPLVFDCPQGTEFNAELKECVWPHESNCNIGAQTEAPATTTYSPEESTSEDSGPQESAPEDSGPQEGRCVEGGLSAHTDCSKYNICSHGAQVAMNCPPGLQWSSKLKQCVWPYQSDCNNYGSGGSQTDAPESAPEDSGPEESSPQESAPGDSGPQESAPEDSGPQEGRCVEGALSAHTDCSKYNICSHGAQVAMKCPPGLQWSSELKQCVWPHQSDCNNYGSVGSQTDAPDNGSQDGGSQDGGSQDGGSQDGGSQDGGSRCEEGALSAHEDCNKYNKCNHGAAVAMDCPPGLHWNAILQYCDWPLTAGCA